MPKNKITGDQCKDTGLALILITLLVALAKGSTTPVVPAIAVLVLTMTAPKLFTPLARLWFGLSHWLGEIVSAILLTIVFFVVVTPIGLVRQLSGKDTMRCAQWKAGRQSVFVRRDHAVCAADLEKPF